ncbi:MAG TPA: hypothetical protein VNT25_01355, partial [Allosphingosinicella sp.]|nr:hypothetical protein [Allosphingosinicella sp.]
MLGGWALLSLQVVGVSGIGAQVPASSAPLNAGAVPQLREEELVLFAVSLDDITLTETLAAYGDPGDPLVPLDELARLVGLDIEVYPSEGRATGRLGESSRALTLDLGLRLARLGGNDIALAPEDVAQSPTDIFVRASAAERLLPVKLRVDSEALLIVMSPTEKLPIQARRERSSRIEGLNRGFGSADPVLRVEAPYRLFAPP